MIVSTLFILRQQLSSSRWPATDSELQLCNILMLNVVPRLLLDLCGSRDTRSAKNNSITFFLSIFPHFPIALCLRVLQYDMPNTYACRDQSVGDFHRSSLTSVYSVVIKNGQRLNSTEVYYT